MRSPEEGAISCTDILGATRWNPLLKHELPCNALGKGENSHWMTVLASSGPSPRIMTALEQGPIALEGTVSLRHEGARIAMDDEALVNEIMTYITAGIRAHGLSVLNWAGNADNSLAEQSGQQFIRSLLMNAYNRQGIEQAVGALAAHLDDPDFQAALRAQIKLALRSSEDVKRTPGLQAPAMPSLGQRTVTISGKNPGQVSIGDNSQNIQVTKKKSLLIPIGLFIRLAKNATSAHPVATAVCSVLAVGTIAGSVVLPNLPANARPSSTGNLIVDPGAEQATPTPGGGQVLVPGWSNAVGSTFTATAYGAAGGFPGPDSPGPSNRGKNFFAGGPGGAVSKASQTDSLEQYQTLIGGGNAIFTLSAWLGGYATQGDYATLTITWQTSSGEDIGQATIGPVTETQRNGVTGMLFRSLSGKVPTAASQVRLTIYMVREAGEYNDGYADNLGLTIK